MLSISAACSATARKGPLGRVEVTGEHLHWVSADPPCFGCGVGLARVDPATGEVIANIDGADEVVAAGRGFLWAAGSNPEELGLRLEWVESAVESSGRLIGTAASLTRIDTETNAATPIHPLGFRWADFTVARGAVWASSPGDGTIVRLDLETGKEKERIPVGGRPVALAAGAGAVWAASREEGRVVRYDIEAGRIETIDVGGTPNDLVFTRDSVWVSVDELTATDYTARAYAICEAAEANLREEFEELEAAGAGNDAINLAAARWAGEVLDELRAVPPPDSVRAEFEHDYSLLERDIEALRL